MEELRIVHQYIVRMIEKVFEKKLTRIDGSCRCCFRTIDGLCICGLDGHCEKLRRL